MLIQLGFGDLEEGIIYIRIRGTRYATGLLRRPHKHPGYEKTARETQAVLVAWLA